MGKFTVAGQDKVVEVLKDVIAGNLSTSEIAQKHGVSASNIASWSHAIGHKRRVGRDWNKIKELLGVK